MSPSIESTGKQSSQPAKLQRLPRNGRIKKRPLLHPAINSPYAGSSHEKVIYVSASTPFIAAVKRVRKVLDNVGKRSRQSEQHSSKGGENKPASEPVLVKATGKAIEKALELALYFQEQADCRVLVRTGSVGTVDDIVYAEATEEGEQGKEERPKSEPAHTEEMPDTQVRRASTVEIAISLR